MFVCVYGGVSAVAVAVSVRECFCFYRSLLQVCVSIYRSLFLLSHTEHPFVWEEGREEGRESAQERASEQLSEGEKRERERERRESVCLCISVYVSAFHMCVCQGVL